MVFNIYEFSTHVTHKSEKFDVTACFEEDGQYDWFQVIFPIEKVDAHEIVNIFPKIKSFIYTTLEDTGAVTPERIPELLADVDADNLYITGKLLERHAYKYDFEVQGYYKFLEPYRVDLMSQDDCFKTCIEHDECKAISYSGASCGLSKKEYSEDVAIVSDDCKLYHKNPGASKKTIQQIFGIINEMVDAEDLHFTIYNKNTTYKFEATKFKSGIGYGRSGKTKGQDEVTSKFHLFRPESKFKDQRTAVQIPYSECLEECTQKTKCNSISFCVINSNCVLHEFHAGDLADEDFLDDSQCIILDRNYEDSFTKLSGLRKIKAEDKLQADSPNHCAKKCLENKKFDCRSFDFCYNEENKKMNCFLHSTHILNSKGDDVDADNCGHYTRNYIFDFQEYRTGSVFYGEIMEKRVTNIAVEGCAMYCIEDPECQTFDYCRDPTTHQSECVTSTKHVHDLQLRDKKNCAVYSIKEKDEKGKITEVARMDAKADNLFADENVRYIDIVEDTGYSKSLTGGIAFFLFLVGLGIGGAAMFGYGYYKANRRIA